MVSIITIGSIELLNGLFGLSGNGGGVEESKVELTKNRLILDQFYSILLHSPAFPLNLNRQQILADPSSPLQSMHCVHKFEPK